MKNMILSFLTLLTFIIILFTCTKDTLFNPSGFQGVTTSAFVCDTTGLDTNITSADSVPGKVIALSAWVGQTTTFIGFIKKDTSVKDITWKWDFGDGKSSLSRIVEHRYMTAGEYKAVFTITNSVGISLSGTVAMTVKTVDGAGVRGYAYLQGKAAHDGITIVFAPAIGTDTNLLQTGKNGFFGLSSYFPKGHYSVKYIDKKTGYYKPLFLSDVTISEGLMNELGKVTLPDEHNPHLYNNQPTDTVDSTRTPVIKATFIDSGSGIAPKTFLFVFDKDTIPDSLVSLNEGGFLWKPVKRLADGNHSVFTSLKDSAGNLVTKSWAFRIDAMKLTAMGDTTFSINATVSMKGKVSNVFHQVAQYKWDFVGDGKWDDSIATSDTVISRPWKYTHEDTSNAILYERDDSGMVKLDTAVIIVGNIAPVIDTIRPDTTISIYDSVPFYGKAHDVDGIIKEYAWDFYGDGTFEYVNTTQINTGYNYDTAGIFKPVIRVTDDDNKVTKDTAIVTVLQDVPQIVFFTKDTIVEHGGSVRCSVSVQQQYGTMDIEIDSANNGNFISLGNVGLTGSKSYYIATGNVCSLDSVKVRVTDDDGNVMSRGFKVDIRPQPLLITTIDSTVKTITVNYSQSQETDFQEYRIYRSTTSSVDTNSELWATIKTSATTSNSISPSFDWMPRYYRIYQKDNEGLWSAGSNVVYGNIVNGPPTKPVITFPQSDGDSVWSNAVLRWTKCSDANNHHVKYRILINYNNSSYVQFATELSDTFKQLQGYEFLGIKFKVIAYDSEGDSSVWSDERLATIRNTIEDIDGNVYRIVKIGNQLWTVENLRVTKYNDGSAIQLVAGNSAWAALSTPGYCYYNNTTNADSIKKFGALYNWYVVNPSVNPSNPKKVAPVGWHVPTDEEWTILENYMIVNGYNWDGTTTGNKIAKSLATKAD
jgi:uncharacterized protein (TIGR02145 family)